MGSLQSEEFASRKKDNLLLTSYSNETPEINTTLIKRGTDKQIILLDGQKDVF